MKKQKPFLISVKIVWLLALANILLTAVGFLAYWQQWHKPQLLITFSSVVFLSTWLIVFLDMSRQKIYQKNFWVFSLFILPTLSPFMYLLQRQRLLRLGQRF
jgi:hypothetical protein